LNLLRFIAWTALLIIVIIIAYAVFAGREYTSPQPLQVAKPLWFAPSYEYRPICTDNIYIDPWIAVNYFGLSVENNKIVYKYTNTSEEAEKVLNNASIDPELYYYYYSILTALVAIPKSNYSTVYDLHPLPVSRDDVEGLANQGLCIYLPKGFEVPKVNASLLTNTSYVIKNVTVYEWNPVFQAYVPRNRAEILNVVTYMPTANITIANSTKYVYAYNVTGFADVNIDAEIVREVVCGNTSAYFADYNKTGYVIYVCSVYGIKYNVTMGYEVNGSRTITDSYTGSSMFTARSCITCTDTVASFDGGSYRGFKPLAKAVIEAKSFYAYAEDQIVNGTPYRYEHYYATFGSSYYTKTLRIYRAIVAINASLGRILTGVLSTMRLTIDVNGTRIELPVNASEPILNASISAYPWESRKLNAGIYLGDVVTIAGSRVINFTRVVRVASMNMSISKPSTDLSRYPWGTTIDVKPIVSIRTWSVRAPSINITAVQKLLSPNPGEVWLEKLTLRYIHDKIAQFIANNSAMNQYFDAFMWLLASQLPANMGSCASHGTATPLLDALCDKCGSEMERVRILHNVTSYSLDAQVKNIGLYYPSYNETIVNATVCIAKIRSYPELWELHNETKGIVYALPEDSHYLVFYNIYEDSPFGDWRRVKQ